MSNSIENAVKLLQSEGFPGAHSFLLLIRYAALTEDKVLLKLVGSTLEELSTMPESAALVYAYAEYYEAAEEEFCRPAAAFLLPRVGREDSMLPLAFAKAARVFGREEDLEQAETLLQKTKAAGPFAALAYLELYRATYNGAWLNRAAELAGEIRAHFHENFDAKKVYDLAEPSENSAVALLYDELFRITQDEKWEQARAAQNHFVSLLADRYPSRVSYGLCALLGDEFPDQDRTVICMLPGREQTDEVRALLSFYSPLTEIIVVPSCGQERAGFFFLKKGKLTPIASL